MDPKNPFLTPQIFLAKLAERIKETKIESTLPVVIKKGSSPKDILEEEFRLINHIYSMLVRKSKLFSDKHKGQRNLTDIMISVSFSIFATTCRQILNSDGDVDSIDFVDMLQSNLNKVFTECGTNLVVKRTKDQK